MTKLTCPAILSARDEDKLRKASPEDYEEYERLLNRLGETEQTRERLIAKIDETEAAYDKACQNIDKFTHKIRVILRQMTMFGE